MKILIKNTGGESGFLYYKDNILTIENILHCKPITNIIDSLHYTLEDNKQKQAYISNQKELKHITNIRILASRKYQETKQNKYLKMIDLLCIKGNQFYKDNVYKRTLKRQDIIKAYQDNLTIKRVLNNI